MENIALVTKVLLAAGVVLAGASLVLLALAIAYSFSSEGGQPEAVEESPGTTTSRRFMICGWAYLVLALVCFMFPVAIKKVQPGRVSKPSIGEPLPPQKERHLGKARSLQGALQEAASRESAEETIKSRGIHEEVLKIWSERIKTPVKLVHLPASSSTQDMDTIIYVRNVDGELLPTKYLKRNHAHIPEIFAAIASLLTGGRPFVLNGMCGEMSTMDHYAEITLIPEEFDPNYNVDYYMYLLEKMKSMDDKFDRCPAMAVQAKELTRSVMMAVSSSQHECVAEPAAKESSSYEHLKIERQDKSVIDIFCPKEQPLVPLYKLVLFYLRKLRSSGRLFIPSDFVLDEDNGGAFRLMVAGEFPYSYMDNKKTVQIMTSLGNALKSESK